MGLAAWLDLDGTLDPAVAARLGVSLDWLLVARPRDPQEAIELAAWLGRSELIDALVLDLGERAVPDRRALDRLGTLLARSGATSVLVLAPAGRAVAGAAASVRVALHRSAWLAIGRDLVGQRTRAVVERQRWALAGGSAELDLWFGEGRRIDPLLAALGNATPGGASRGASGAARGGRLMARLLVLAWPELRAPDAETATFEPMLDALDDLSPRVEAVDVGVALVDVTGLEPMWGPERRVAARAVMLTRAVAPMPVRCGIGDNRWLATLAARLARFERPEAPAAFRILERDELDDLPLALLPADAATRQRFGLFGLTEMRQLAGLPRSAVGAQFGPVGERLQALARGHDPRPIVPRRRPERVEAAEEFEVPLDGIGAVSLTLRRLAADLCDQLRERRLAPGRATLELVLEDAPMLRVAQPFPQPALEPDWIARLLLSRLEAAARARSCRPPEPAEEGSGRARSLAACCRSGQLSARQRPARWPLAPARATRGGRAAGAAGRIGASWRSIASPIPPRGKWPPSRHAPGAGRSCDGRSSGSGIGSVRAVSGGRRTSGRPRRCRSIGRGWWTSARDPPLSRPSAGPGRDRCRRHTAAPAPGRDRSRRGRHLQPVAGRRRLVARAGGPCLLQGRHPLGPCRGDLSRRDSRHLAPRAGLRLTPATLREMAEPYRLRRGTPDDTRAVFDVFLPAIRDLTARQGSPWEPNRDELWG